MVLASQWSSWTLLITFLSGLGFGRAARVRKGRETDERLGFPSLESLPGSLRAVSAARTSEAGKGTRGAGGALAGEHTGVMATSFIGKGPSV